MPCGEPNPAAGVPVTVAIASDDIDLELQLKEGGLEGEGMASTTQARVYSRGEFGCREKKNIKYTAATVKTRVWCPTLQKPGRTCMKSMKLGPDITLELDRRVRVRSAAIDAVFDRIELELDGDGDWEDLRIWRWINS